MKIGQLPSQTGTAVAQAPSATAAGKPSARSATPADVSNGQGSTPLSLSNTAWVARSAGATGDFDADKVKAVCDAIANGSYTVNPEAIANKLLANAQDMLNRGVK